MCGIVGYIGSSQAAPLLLEGLRRLEYRGYDSAGLSVCSNGRLDTRKVAGPINTLVELIGEDVPKGTVGIAHTRWATHGPPNTINAHPHHDASEEIAVVHNGIIENADVLRRKLEELGHTFRSETDSEVLAHLIEAMYKGNLEQAVAAALSQVEGTFGLAVVSSRDPDKVVAARQGAPLLIGLGDDKMYFVASDAAAVDAHARCRLSGRRRACRSDTRRLPDSRLKGSSADERSESRDLGTRHD